MWTHHQTSVGTEGYLDRLRREADELDRSADRMKGCSFYGDPPWLGPQRDATDKRLLAALLERDLFNKPKDK